MNGLRAAMAPILLAPALLVTGCGAKSEKSASASTGPKVVPVTISGVEIRPVERMVDAVGTLKGWDEVTVGAKKIGRVAKVLHDIGDRVKPGEMLVEFELRDSELCLTRPRSNCSPNWPRSA